MPLETLAPEAFWQSDILLFWDLIAIVADILVRAFDHLEKFVFALGLFEPSGLELGAALSVAELLFEVGVRLRDVFCADEKFGD